MAEHSALYRKYRPQSFSEVLGQEHVVSVLEGSIKEGAIAHAYLFTGSRGTGKTSVARIFAREIGVVERDLYEMDAASNRGIDEIRALREEVHTLPFSSPYKVYVIDECHMLTKDAWNALLKTLEEPPAHVLFILATTELDKVPDTIQSRCQTFTFKKPGTALLKELVTRVASSEGRTLAPEAAELIAFLADGSYRDAHGILQKIIGSSHEKKIDAARVEEVSGAPKGAHVLDVLRGIATNDPEVALGALRRIGESGIDMRVFARLILRALRAVLLLRAAPGMREELRREFAEHEFSVLEEMATTHAATINSRLLSSFLEALPALGLTYVPGLPLELVIIEHTRKNS